jgi:hypothetical protein
MSRKLSRTTEWGVRNNFEAGIDKDMERRCRMILYLCVEND